MFKTENKIAQAAIELAVFGAIIIFILGTIVRSALGNAYSQNENFKAMRMAMLASWKGSELHQGKGAQADTTHNNASILIVEDRLSPDFNKYGPLDRNLYIASASGTFTYNLYYPWQPGIDPPSNLEPIMDIWINGQHFPFTTASYVVNRVIQRTSCPPGGPYESYPLTAGQCYQNQCLRNEREWAGGIVNANQFANVMPTATLTNAAVIANGQAIFSALCNAGVVSTATGSCALSTGIVSPGFSVMPSPFNITDPSTGQLLQLTQQEINDTQTILQGDANQYKLFYTRVANGGPGFSTSPPGVCSGKDNALCTSLTVTDAFGNPFTNANGDMSYDLLRNGDYNSGGPMAVETQFPVGGQMRSSIAWNWVATPGTDSSSIGLDASSNQYPSYDINGSLSSQEPVIYSISQDSAGEPVVSYEDFQGGDIDTSWDSDSCGPKPGLQNNTQIYTFTMNGTYLEIKEGKLYNPETDAFVRSANKRDTLDMVQRTIQLSNNTGNFLQWDNTAKSC